MADVKWFGNSFCICHVLAPVSLCLMEVICPDEGSLSCGLFVGMVGAVSDTKLSSLKTSSSVSAFSNIGVYINGKYDQISTIY